MFLSVSIDRKNHDSLKRGRIVNKDAQLAAESKSPLGVEK